jgi:xanthine dehydrogenase accessory factor
MTPTYRSLCEAIEAEGAAALITLVRCDGSSPREAGARMVVRPSGRFVGTIGGGALEWEALRRASAKLADGRGADLVYTQALGPDLGQCCGGRVELLIEVFTRRDLVALAGLAQAETQGHGEILVTPGPDGRRLRQVRDAGAGPGPLFHVAPDGTLVERLAQAPCVLLFGAGHVGRAMVLALAPLPFSVRWIDPRREAFLTHVPANVSMIQSLDMAGEIAAAPDQAYVLVMSHSHALDFEIVAEALAARRFAFVGLIGSQTKSMRFARRLRQAGFSPDALAQLTCPIGLAGISGKEPAIIAAATVAQLLQHREARLSAYSPSRQPEEAALPVRFIHRPQRAESQ